jgi:hypothetical protein
MRRSGRFLTAALATGVAAGALVTLLSVPAAADSSSVRWKTIVGIEDAGNANNAVGGIGGGGQAWTTLGGNARVDLAGGNVDFEVHGLVLAGGNAIGTPDGINRVKGTLVCDAGQPDQVVVDTPLVTLSAQGDAEFDGNVGAISSVCTASNTAFLVRIAAGRWIANGAVRTSHGD